MVLGQLDRAEQSAVGVAPYTINSTIYSIPKLWPTIVAQPPHYPNAWETWAQDDSQGPDVRRAAHLHCALLHSLHRTGVMVRFSVEGFRIWGFGLLNAIRHGPSKLEA